MARKTTVYLTFCLIFDHFSGKKHGPYGGIGGYYFDAQAPNENCFLGWISGRLILCNTDLALKFYKFQFLEI